MVYLAEHAGARPVPLTEIVTHEGIPGPFLERILAQLRESGLVMTTRGVCGGYQLALGTDAIPVGDIVTALEGPLALVDCVPDASGCERSQSCVSRTVWSRLDNAVNGALNGITLKDLTAEVESR